jgi:alpha-galactosidase
MQDMMEVGNLRGPLAINESRSHFGAWAIVSSPLILGLDITNQTNLDSVWPFLSSSEAIAVNQAWDGDK